jgi:hypothetical protein
MYSRNHCLQKKQNAENIKNTFEIFLKEKSTNCLPFSERLILFIFYFWCFNATFSNISAISWRPVLVVEETGVPGENHRPWAINW